MLSILIWNYQKTDFLEEFWIWCFWSIFFFLILLLEKLNYFCIFSWPIRIWLINWCFKEVELLFHNHFDCLYFSISVISSIYFFSSFQPCSQRSFSSIIFLIALVTRLSFFSKSMSLFISEKSFHFKKFIRERYV